MATTIGLADVGDLRAVGELTVAAYTDFTLGPEDPYVEHLRDAATRAAQAELWIAADGPQLLGTVTICPQGSPLREVAQDDEGEFRMLAVSPTARRRGVGRLLVQHCLDRIGQQGAPAVVLCSLEDMTPAHRLYGSLGFERLPERDWEPRPGIRLLAFRAML